MGFYGYDRDTLTDLLMVLRKEYEVRCRDVILNPKVSNDNEDIRYRSGALSGLQYAIDVINELLNGQGEVKDYE